MEGPSDIRLEVRDYPVDHGKRCVAVRAVVLLLLQPAERGEAGGYAGPGIGPYRRCMAEVVVPELAP